MCQVTIISCAASNINNMHSQCEQHSFIISIFQPYSQRYI